MTSENDDKKDKPKNFFERTAEKLENAVNNTAERLEEGINKIQQDYKNKVGIPGEISDIVDNTVAKGKELKQKIDDKGGIGNIIKDTYDKGVESMEVRYKDLENKICTNGVYDPKKATEFVKDKALLAKTYGKQGADYLIKMTVELGTKARDVVMPNWSAIVPSKQDLSEGGKYYRLGSNYQGRFLFTETCENTVNFKKKAEKKFETINPFGLKDEILEDIWVSASGNAGDLTMYYKQTQKILNIPQNTVKSTIVTKYLTGE